jgi:hypothetical protein
VNSATSGWARRIAKIAATRTDMVATARHRCEPHIREIRPKSRLLGLSPSLDGSASLGAVFNSRELWPIPIMCRLQTRATLRPNARAQGSNRPDGGSSSWVSWESHGTPVTILRTLRHGMGSKAPSEVSRPVGFSECEAAVPTPRILPVTLQVLLGARSLLLWPPQPRIRLLPLSSTI